MQLCAMTASATVSLTCRSLKVGPERIVKTMTREQLDGDTRLATLFFTSLSLGVAGGSIDLIRERAASRGSETLATAARALEVEREAARQAVDAAAERLSEPDGLEAAHQARAWCVDLGARAALAAVTASSGSANLRDNPAQRLWREAMVYALTAQTGDLQTAILERLSR
jgi:alkylation response protein AidB-like acyl-CoA dehydrogenase